MADVDRWNRFRDLPTAQVRLARGLALFWHICYQLRVDLIQRACAALRSFSERIPKEATTLSASGFLVPDDEIRGTR